MDSSPQKSWSPKEWAQRHGVCTRTVHRWIKTGRVRVIRITKRTIRIVPANHKM